MDVLLQNEILMINNSINKENRTLSKENKTLSTSLKISMFDCFNKYYAFSLALGGQIIR